MFLPGGSCNLNGSTEAYWTLCLHHLSVSHPSLSYSDCIKYVKPKQRRMRTPLRPRSRLLSVHWVIKILLWLTADGICRGEVFHHYWRKHYALLAEMTDVLFKLIIQIFRVMTCQDLLLIIVLNSFTQKMFGLRLKTLIVFSSVSILPSL